eukprot:5657215-Pyramimonas_sp.AAC.1
MAGNHWNRFGTSGASAFGIQSSELCPLPELGPPNCSYCSSYVERCCRFPALNSGCRGAARLVITGRDHQTRPHVASKGLISV